MDKELIDVLKSMCAIFEGNDEDVLNILNMHHQVRKFDKTYRSLTIIPTLDCNFKCGYCFELETIRSLYMSDEVEKKLIDFISSEYEKDKNLKKLNIVWFGDKGRMIIDNTNFAFNSAALSKSAVLILDKVCKFLKANPSSQILMYGFTDNVGDDAFNLKLSSDRALSVQKYFLSKGIDESRMKTEGKGKSDPIASNETNEGKAKNRRVEIKIISE
jgi:outer membrane protein OmpA-like peptidoglycan-associated protein